MGKIYKGDVGVKIELLLCADITNVNKVMFLVKKPSGKEVVWISKIEDSKNGKVSYVTGENDLDESGEYRIQALVEFEDGSKLYSESKTFYVSDLYE